MSKTTIVTINILSALSIIAHLFFMLGFICNIVATSTADGYKDKYSYSSSNSYSPYKYNNNYQYSPSSQTDSTPDAGLAIFAIISMAICCAGGILVTYGFGFTLWMIIDALSQNSEVLPRRYFWALLMLCTGIFGSTVYFNARKIKIEKLNLVKE